MKNTEIVIGLMLLVVLIIMFRNRIELFTETSPVLKYRNIFIYWEQGWENAPLTCKLCLKSWQKYNPTWNIIKLDKSNIKRYLDIERLVPTFWEVMPIASRSDILRINLLNKYNGVWVDATLFCTKPLDTWIHRYGPLFAFEFSQNVASSIIDDDKKMLSSWFLYKSRPNYIVTKWAKVYNKYWDKRVKADDYFQFHLIFTNLYKTDVMFKGQWDKSKRLSNSGPHLLKTASLSDAFKQHVDHVMSPVYKLDHSYKTSQRIRSGAPNIVNYLIRRHGLLNTI